MKKTFLLLIFYGFTAYGMKKSLIKEDYSSPELTKNKMENNNNNVQIIPEQIIDDSLPWNLRKPDYSNNTNSDNEKTKQDILFALWSGYYM